MSGNRGSPVNAVSEIQKAILFESDNIIVRSITGFDRKSLVVSFDPYSDDRNLNRLGFAENFFPDRRVDSVHILSRDNDWYQYADLPQALDAVGKVAAGYDRVVSYGSSMGGYAAIRYGGRAGADAAFALSPQYSIDPNLCPWETRWAADAQRISFLQEELRAGDAVGKAVIVFDPHDVDAQHARLFSGLTRTTLVALPYSGHPCTGFLADVGLLAQSVLAFAEGSFDHVRMQEEARGRRKSSAQYFHTLASRLSRGHRAWRIACARRATELKPEDAILRSHLARILDEYEAFEEAEGEHRAALAIRSGNPVILYHYSEHLQRSGDLLGALDIMGRLIKDYSNSLYSPRFALLYEEALRKASQAKAARSRVPDVFRRSLYSVIAAGGGRAGLKHLVRRWRDRGFLFGRYGLAPGFSFEDTDVCAATLPSPPQNAVALRRHLMQVALASTVACDTMLVGDSHAEYWPSELWEGSALNLGVAGDKTQSTLWRLDDLEGRLVAPRRILLVVGTNNLGMGDSACAIHAGIAALHRRLRKMFGAHVPCLVLELPPVGPGGTFRAEERRMANERISADSAIRSVNVDEALAAAAAAGIACYTPDDIHFTHAGYRVLQARIEEAFAEIKGADMAGRVCRRA